ncbi:cytochrome bd-type quinol oxidase subunit 2 [Thermosporothrix hazakensis]|jgi:hypothetical protein|uniref:Cytochrome bd-type quinol oxidase subunit 2 n=1 Tax=Thermosporothrix hazakensis TaxID=644383 RepID=A0A326U1C4_THEHA|nr:DUF4129 domain-containing protein [Thermosporothrix hazakensis]PZW24663.1 cytochrome bd-type quinol oxidase subunit 2 [Thermosporothrix hazakensis]GCE48389.1 hypothetical protein KTH_32580 [Thermosporothrix hazakensis]
MKTPSATQEVTQETGEPLSTGAQLLPLVFTVMEICCIYALFVGFSSVHVLGLHDPVMPFWGMLLLAGGAMWLSILLEKRAAKMMEAGKEPPSVAADAIWLFGLMIILEIPVLWGGLYAGSFAVWDARWFGALAHDFLTASPAFYRICLILMLSIYFGWRAVTLARQTLEPGRVFLTFRIGIGVLAVAGILRAMGQDMGNDPALFLVVLLFICCTVIAHALANASFIRETHAQGLFGSVEGQERNILSVVLAICAVFAVVALLAWLLISPELLGQIVSAVAPAYNAVVMVIATVVGWIVTPFYYVLSPLLSWLAAHLFGADLADMPEQKRYKPPVGIFQPTKDADPTTLAIGEIVRYALPIIVLLALAYGIARMLRKRRSRVRQRPGEQRESIWSWELFTTQLRAFLRSFWLRFFPQKQDEKEQVPAAVIAGSPMARTVREIYRALLQWAALRGVTRKQGETPYEFERRLRAYISQGEPELKGLTETYTQTRYSGSEPSQDVVVQTQQQWQAFQQQARFGPGPERKQNYGVADS